MFRLVVFGLFTGAVLICAGLVALGMPPAFAGTIGFLAMGLVPLFLTGWLGDSRPLAAIIVFGLIAEVLFIVAIGQAVGRQANGAAVTGLVVGAELLAAIAVHTGYRLAWRRVRGIERQRLAQAAGWRFDRTAAEATALLPGMSTIIGRTSGEVQSVVRGQIDGTEFTVFDVPVVRRLFFVPAVRTVYLIRLPMALPYLPSSFTEYLAVQERPDASQMSTSELIDQLRRTALAQELQPWGAENEDCARALMTGVVRAACAQCPPWWIDGQHLVGLRRLSRGTPRDQLVADLDGLAKLTRLIPWSALSKYAVESGEPGARYRRWLKERARAAAAPGKGD